MADPQIVTTLRRKRDEIERTIAAYEKKIAQARRDLSSVNATLALFEQDADPESRVYLDTLRLFRRGEIATLCKDALAKEGPLTTRELAVYVAKAKGFDENDTVFRKSLCMRIVQALTLQWKRGTIVSPGKRGNVRTWSIKNPA